jgi:tRNA(fMet)-specific endonuclease VapC
MAKNQIILCDTNIFINLFKGNSTIKSALDKIGPENVAFSIVTYSEIIYGTKKANLGAIKQFFDSMAEYHVDEETSKIFKGLSLSYSYNHHIKIPDALIAATALRHNLPLYTENKKDFDFIEGLKLHK